PPTSLTTTSWPVLDVTMRTNYSSSGAAAGRKHAGCENRICCNLFSHGENWAYKAKKRGYSPLYLFRLSTCVGPTPNHAAHAGRRPDCGARYRPDPPVPG